MIYPVACGVLAALLVGCSSQPKDVGPTRYVFDTQAPVPSGELREEAGQIIHTFRPVNDIVEIMPYETFAIGAHRPFIVEQVRVTWSSADGKRHDVLFRIDSDAVEETQESRLAQFIDRHRATIQSVVIEGRADSTGQAEHNMDLSRRRAESVQSQLVALGVSAERITTAYFGQSDPIATNATASGRQRNRSSRVVLSP
jgi:outer membrane protein OmpA-like peptidoglycan-associated protein